MTIREELKFIDAIDIVLDAIEDDISFNDSPHFYHLFGGIDRKKILDEESDNRKNASRYILYGFTWIEYEKGGHIFANIYNELESMSNIFKNI